MARKLNRIALSLILVCLAIGAASLPGATAKVYSFKPARAGGGSVVFLIDNVRPASVRAARIRLGHYKPRRLTLAKARRAVRRGRLRLPLAPIAGGTRAPAPSNDIATLAKRSSRLKIVTDTNPPETKITSGPSGTVSSDSASFKFSASERDGKFQCKRGSGEWSPCDSPKAYSNLADGSHLFGVRAIDKAGNVDPTPAGREWTVATAPPPPAAGAPMVEGFDAPNGPNNLITNEYAAWRSWDSAAVQSPVWKSDGGSLFSVAATGPDGGAAQVAYTGTLDSDAADRYSEANTHSNKLRFFSKAGGYGNVRVGAWIKPLDWGAGVPTTWGGFKLYLRRESTASVASAYTAEPYIYSGRVYIQKKCAGETGGGNYANGGTYYLLASKSGLDVPLGSWHKVEASAQTNADGSVTISVYRDGTLVLQTVDHGIRPDGTGCPPLSAGHVGFRSDFLRYYLEDYTVSPLG